MPSYENIEKNLRLIVVLRRSTNKQRDSLERQRDLIRSLMMKIGATTHSEIVLEDHSATAGAHWGALYDLIDRKRDGEEFDGVCASDYSRIGRNRDDCEQFYFALKRVKLKLITHREGMLNGSNKWRDRNDAAAHNEEYAATISTNINSALMDFIKRGIIPHTQTHLFGVDRMHVLAEGEKPLFRLRRLPNGTVLKLDPVRPDATNPIFKYEGATRHLYPRRQGEEKVVLVPGDETQLAAVVRIFEMYYVQSFGYAEVAEYLNADGLKSPTGRNWTIVSVRNIVMNHTYTGVGVCCQVAQGVHSMRHKNGPILFSEPRSKEEGTAGTENKGLSSLARPKDEWFATRCPRLLHILPKGLRRVVKAANRKRRRTPLRTCVTVGIRNSKFFLTGLIRLAGTEYIYWGAGRAQTYYRPSHEMRRLEPRNVFQRMIRAEIAENIFFDVISRLIRGKDDLRTHISEMLRARIALQMPKNERLARLLEERVAVQDHLDMIHEAGPEASGKAKEKARELTAKLKQLKADIDAEKRPDVLTDPAHIPATVERILESLDDLPSRLEDANPRRLRRIALLLIQRIDFDPIANTLVFKLRLTKRLSQTQDSGGFSGRWSSDFSRTKKNATPPRDAIQIGSFKYLMHKGCRHRKATFEFQQFDLSLVP